MKHILTVNQFSNEELVDIFTTSNHLEYSAFEVNFKKKILANLFYEPSTRTSSSFYAAMARLGGQTIPINDVNYSSVVKGETLEDTIRTMQCYVDAIVLRHKEVGAAARAAAVATVPIINGGDGIGEHPTQALLDFYTVIRERNILFYCSRDLENAISQLTFTMMGDLKHGRTVKSLVQLARKYGAKINWVSPKELRIPEEFRHNADKETDNLDEVIRQTDVLYVTRVQKERIEGYSDFSYGVTPQHMKKAKSNMVLMHPLPRTNELPTSLDSDPRSAYFRQMRYGLFVRMAILYDIFK